MLDDGGRAPQPEMLRSARLMCRGARRSEPGARLAGAAFALGVAFSGCARRPEHSKPDAVAASQSTTAPSGAGTGPSKAATAPPGALSSARVTPRLPPSCPPGTAFVPGGRFWVGAEPGELSSADESPRFLTDVLSLCADVTEVTVSAYNRCVASGRCSAASSKRALCNGAHPERADHPINCVTFRQAEAYCRAQGARLPTEVEWEYLARGGTAYLKYPWGDESPDGRACWKTPRTCPVKSFAAGAFGLFDISGNVWEWTDSWYGAYPWPPTLGFAKVYRGGSFSRRFEKWMHTRLRNRADPDQSGAHLGFRCVVTAAGQACPFGANAEGGCLHGVLDRDCSPGSTFNGVRCAEPGAPRCRVGRVERPGYGCVLPDEPPPEARDLEAETRGVTRRRDAQFDPDCAKNQPSRPRAFRFEGGTHDGRNLVGRRAGCKNRDVGVGWNSVCCP